MRFSGQISDFAIRSWLIHRTRLTALHFRSTGDTHLQLLPHTPSRADQRFASLWPSRGAPQQRTCLIGVEFPLPGPQVWTFTSCSLLMPDTLPRPAGSSFTSPRHGPGPLGGGRVWYAVQGLRSCLGPRRANRIAGPSRRCVRRSGVKEEAEGRGTAAAPNAPPAWSRTTRRQRLPLSPGQQRSNPPV